jgi:hypothetical protein
MRESKLYEVISQLSGHELNRLHRFVISPYFNRNEPIIRLFEWIKDDLKQTESKELDKEELWKITFGMKDAFDDGRFRKLQSDLLKLVEEFFAQEAFESNPMHKAKYLLDSILDKGLENLQATAFKSAYRLMESQTLRPSSHYYFQYEIEQSMYRIHQRHAERSVKSNIENIALNLDRFYLGEKLRYYCTILNHQLLAALSYEMLFINEIISHIENHDYSDVPSISIYYQILLTYKEPEVKAHYDRLKELIDKHILLFPDYEAKEILDAALNYSLKRMNAGESAYIRETFNLYVQFLESGALFVNGQITPWSFKNIVTTGLRLNEFDWIENFIKQYSSYIDERYRENAITFNLAQFYFYKKEYSDVIRLLSKVEYEDLTYNLNSKTLLMASYYELDEIEALNSLLDTFRVYLSRNNKIPAARRKHYLNTISIVRKLAKIRPGDHKEIDKLEKEIETTQGVVSKNWIMEKLEALK